MSLEEAWAECDHCGTCVRDGGRRLEVLCEDCRAAAARAATVTTEGHALLDEAIVLADRTLLRDGK